MSAMKRITLLLYATKPMPPTRAPAVLIAKVPFSGPQHLLCQIECLQFQPLSPTEPD
jgi:hypothetical protein